MRHADEMLTRFGVPHECRVVSAHRTPVEMAEYARRVEARGLRGDHRRRRRRGAPAGHGRRAHHAAGARRARREPGAQGLDSLLSIVQMPAGVPVGTLAIGKAGATNAALLAVAILATTDAGAARATARVPSRADVDASSRTPSHERRAHSSRLDVGVLGSGQLGRMFAIAARRMGYRVHTSRPTTTRPPARSPTSRSARPTTISTPFATVRPRRRRRHVRVRERARRDDRCGRGHRARPAERPRAAHHPAPAARKDFLADTRLPGHAVRVRFDSRRPRSRARDGRTARRAEDRRASATTARARSIDSTRDRRRRRGPDGAPGSRARGVRRLSTASSRSSPPAGSTE